MTERNQQGPIEPLDRATEALRNVPVPDGPPPHLTASTVEALQFADIPPERIGLNERKKLMLRITRYSGVAAAILFVAVLAGWLFLMDRSAGVAFADVVDKVTNAKSVSCVMKQQSDKQPEQEGRLYIQGQSIRSEVLNPDGSGPVGITIWDLKQKKMLNLLVPRKIALTSAIDDEEVKHLPNPMDEFTKLDAKKAKRVGQREKDGRKLDVFEVKEEDNAIWEVWVDQKTGLPVRMEAKDSPQGRVVFEQFTWNEALDPNLFKLDVPQGFTVQDN